MYSTTPDDFRIEKPHGWETKPLFSKLFYYKNQLGPQYAPYVDKIIAKQIIQDLCGDKIKVAPLIRILAGPEDFTESDLDPTTIVKSAHGSGWNISITEITTVEEVKTKLKEWNKIYEACVTGESQYQYLQPRFFIEKKIEDPLTGTTGKAQVYMFRCIHGTPMTFGIRRGNIQNNYFFEKTPITPEIFHFEFPQQYEEMLFWAEKLSQPFEFVRIDFYLSNDGFIYFSEFTFTPSGGAKFFPLNVEKELGQLWI